MSAQAATIAYTVGATMPAAIAERYMHWLVTDHMAKVMRAGAFRAEAVLLDAESGATDRTVQARYGFLSRAALETYLRDAAPALRAEGLAAFPAELGIRFERSTGTISQPRTL